MKVIVLEEHGYYSAALGFSLSYNTTIERAFEILPKFAFGKSGERKFLESIMLWLQVTSSRSVWQEADTYRIATKQSESTMHTLHKRPLTEEDWEYPLPDGMLKIVNEQRLRFLNKEIKKYQFKNCLPEGFLQTRVWCMSYKTLQNIYEQRHNHELPQWGEFLTSVLQQIYHPEFVVKGE